jgi:hypothetical protein
MAAAAGDRSRQSSVAARKSDSVVIKVIGSSGDRKVAGNTVAAGKGVAQCEGHRDKSQLNLRMPDATGVRA